MTSAGSVERDATLRLFLALQLPDDVRATLAGFAEVQLRGMRLVRPDDLHVTLAFLGSRPQREVAGVVSALRGAVGRLDRPLALTPERWRETRSVGMVALRDESGGAGDLARDLHRRLEALGVYRPERRPWFPHVTVVRFRERPRLAPPLPPLGTFVPSGAAAYISRLHPSGARYEVLESMTLE